MSREGISFRNYGFWATETAPVDIRNEPNLEAHTARQYPGYNLAIRDQVRYREWVREFRRYEKRGEMPSVQFVKFPNDHTCDTHPACPTPQAMVADSDWATGKLVDQVSHSKFWRSTAIFQIEDDAQDGPDHVDAHRTVGHVISLYTQIGKVDSTFYSSVSMLRTMEMILGLSPLTQFHAVASPMLNSFTNEPDFTPYNSVKPKQSLNEPNPENAPMAGQSSKMDFSMEDQAPWRRSIVRSGRACEVGTAGCRLPSTTCRSKKKRNRRGRGISQGHACRGGGANGSARPPASSNVESKPMPA